MTTPRRTGSRVPSRVLLLLVLLAAVPAHAAWEHLGQTASGAVYRFAVPEGWRPGDGLVVYQHDLSFERDLDPDLGPLAAEQLAQGYAVAASGYSQSGWAVLGSARDNRELVDRFRVQLGDPGPILTYGSAMGGHIALLMAEDPSLAVAGALALCPSAAADRHWQAALDLRVAYDAVCEGVAGGELPKAADQPWLLPPDRITVEGLQDIVLRSNRCIGASLPAWQRNDAQQARLARLKSVAGIDDDALVLLALGHATLGLSDLVRDPAKLAGGLAVGNTGVAYGAGLDGQVARIDADPFAALDLRLRANPAGAGNARILSLHTQHDPLMAPGHASWLAARIDAERLVHAVVADAAPSHCGFTATETRAAWDALRSWVVDAVRPDAAALQARCQALDGADPGGDACRIDPEADIAALDETIRVRADVPRIDGRFSGEWIDPDHAGERWLVEVLDARTALVYLLADGVGPAGDAPLWLLGIGRVDGDGIVVPQLHGMRGGGFGAANASRQAQVIPSGELRLVFAECGQARARLHASGAAAGERALTQLRNLGSLDCSLADTTPPPGAADVSGSWYDSVAPGQGLVVNVDDMGEAAVTLFTYAPATGEPLWLRGEGMLDADGRIVVDEVEWPLAARGLDNDRPDARDWGSFDLSFQDCETAVLRYRSRDRDFGEGEIAFSRLTRPAGLTGCRTPDAPPP